MMTFLKILVLILLGGMWIVTIIGINHVSFTEIVVQAIGTIIVFVVLGMQDRMVKKTP